MKLTESQIQQIARQTLAGNMASEIAKELNLTDLQVKNAINKLRKLGLELPRNTSNYEKVAAQLKNN